MTLVDRFFSKVEADPNGGCWLWAGAVTPKGYGSFCVRPRASGEAQFNASAHRVSWSIHKGEPPKDLHVLHRCDVRACVNPDHLFLGTNQDNVDDKISKGRSGCLRGEASPVSKMTNDQARKIKVMLANAALKATEIAKAVGVTPKQVYDIKYGVTWRES